MDRSLTDATSYGREALSKIYMPNSVQRAQKVHDAVHRKNIRNCNVGIHSDSATFSANFYQGYTEIFIKKATSR